jgi:transmembrane sensor
MPPELREALGDRAAAPAARLWSALGVATPPRPVVPDDTAALADLERRLDRPAGPTRRALRADRPARAGAARGPFFAAVRWAVPALLVALVATGTWAWRQPVTAVAAAGEQVAVRLPDGSTATLNSGSRLRYARRFEAWPFVEAAVRVVRLEGEAFFEVAHTGRPFVVETPEARVEVLGTTFDVRARPEAGGTRVTLASGRVRVATRVGREAAVLAHPGASAVVAPGAVTPRVATVPLAHALAWRAEGFSAVDEPLPAILAEVERRFAVEVDVEGALPAGAMNLFYPRGATAEQILHDVCLARGCRFWRTSRGFGLRMTTTREGVREDVREETRP